MGIWTIQKRDEIRLDRYEGYYPDGYCYYDKEQIPVKMKDGRSVTGMVYIMNQKQAFGSPTRGYYETVRQGYKDCHLDLNVLETALDNSIELAQHRMEQEPVQLW